MVGEVTSSTMARVTVVREVDQSSLVISVAGCWCACHGQTWNWDRRLAVGLGRLVGEVARRKGCYMHFQSLEKLTGVKSWDQKRRVSGKEEKED